MKELYRKPDVLEITSGWNFAYRIMQYHDDYTLIVTLFYFTFYISLPHFGYNFKTWDRAWGVYWHASAIWFCWGKKIKSFNMPWSWDFIKHEVLNKDGEWEKAADICSDIGDGRVLEKYPYGYMLDKGVLQRRTATIYVERREWRWKWFKWLGWPKRVAKTIDVKFDKEVGEESGSYKGGVLGCGYDMLPNETAEECLIRMEIHRKF